MAKTRAAERSEALQPLADLMIEKPDLTGDILNISLLKKWLENMDPDRKFMPTPEHPEGRANAKSAPRGKRVRTSAKSVLDRLNH